MFKNLGIQEKRFISINYSCYLYQFEGNLCLEMSLGKYNNETFLDQEPQTCLCDTQG